MKKKKGRDKLNICICEALPENFSPEPLQPTGLLWLGDRHRRHEGRQGGGGQLGGEVIVRDSMVGLCCRYGIICFTDGQLAAALVYH